MQDKQAHKIKEVANSPKRLRKTERKVTSMVLFTKLKTVRSLGPMLYSYTGPNSEIPIHPLSFMFKVLMLACGLTERLIIERNI